VTGWMRDLRVAVRSLRRSPGFAAVVILTLALGIGANSAVFSVVNSVLLRPLDYGSPERLVAIYQTIPDRDVDRAPTSPLNFLDWREGATSFEGMAAYVPAVYGLLGDGPPEQVWGAEVSAELFDVLRVSAWRGRTLVAGDGEPDAEAVAVISHRLWQRIFGADPEILGELVRLDDRPYRVVGIMPPGFTFVDRAEVWTPLVFTPEDLAVRGRVFLETVARLAPGRSLSQARDEMTALNAAVAEENTGNPRAWGARVVPFRQAAAGDLPFALLVLSAVVGFVLLVACVNVANLLLARGAERRGELALRAALGAGRGRIFRQLLTESLLLSFLGGVAGLALASAVAATIRAAPGNLPRLAETEIDLRVLAFTLLVSVATGVIFGLFPALRASRPDLAGVMKGAGGKTTAGHGRHLARKLLVTFEVALALVVLIAAGLMVRSFQEAQALDPGFEPDKVLALSLIEPDGKFRDDRERLVYYRRLLEELSRLPRSQAVGASTSLPLSERQLSRISFLPEGLQLQPGESPPFAAVDGVTADFFRALGLPILQGRPFTDADLEGGPPVAIVDQRLADGYWPGEDPIGKTVVIPGRDAGRREVVGVAGRLSPLGLDASPDPRIYVPLDDRVERRISFFLRFPEAPEDLADEARSAVWEVDRTQAIATLTTMEELLADALARRRFLTRVIGLFASLVLLLAVVGIHGVTSYSVAQRTREIGIRRAFGAREGQVLGLIVGQGMRWVLLGLAAGVAGALALTRFLSSLLYGVGAGDPWTYLAVSAAFVAVAVVANLLPAWRGVRIDPVTALRYE